METKLFIILCYICYCYGDNSTTTSPSQNSTEIPPDCFYYFAYGSNLLQKRIHINAPSAKFYSIAKLKDYRLDFNVPVSMWNGAVATIAHDPGSQVWGVVWIINKDEMPALDRQEGLGKLYYDLEVTVATRDKKLKARIYKQYVDPPKEEHPWKIPSERLPSRTYLKVILYGAAEAGLPYSYIKKLTFFQDNGMEATSSVREQLGYPFTS